MALTHSSYLLFCLSLFLINDIISLSSASPINQPPTLARHLEKLTVVAGEIFRYKIPEDLFIDPEGGSLTYSVYNDQDDSLGQESWIQFNPETREIYGLPLEEHISRWHFIVKAKDGVGDVATSPLDITVEQHQGRRAVNHQFRVTLKLLKDYSNAVDWQIRILQGLQNLFGEADRKLIVLAVARVEDMIDFAWANDNLPKGADCPHDDVERLYKILESTEKPHRPSASLIGALSPEFEVKNVIWRGIGGCALLRIRRPAKPLPSHSTTTVGQTNEVPKDSMLSDPPINQPPTLNQHTEKLVVTTGKPFKYIIPEDLFTDPEGGSLTYSVRDEQNNPLGQDSWIQFNPETREVYGLPLEQHVSRWSFIVEARDSAGDSATETLDITVQQNKAYRTINHLFTMNFKQKKNYTNNIDWQIRTLQGLQNLFGDNTNHLSVLGASRSIRWNEFVWTNDTIPKGTVCPEEDIERLYKILRSTEKHKRPSAGLISSMSPDFEVNYVAWRGVGTCPVERLRNPIKIVVPASPPTVRNQLDRLTATVGQLFTYKVPEDTFYDIKDGNTRNLALSLRQGDGTEIAAGNWLQFNAKDQEFRGQPAAGDEGSASYQLVAENSSKKLAYDSFTVEVVKSPSP